MPGMAEVLRGLWGSWRLLILDRHGIQAFEGSRPAALRSFWVVLLLLPLTAITTSILIASDQESASHGLISAIANCSIAWVLPLIVIYGLVRWYGRGERFWLLLSALNWSQIVQGLLGLLSVALTAGAKLLVGPDVAQGTPTAAMLTGVVLAQLGLLVTLGTIFYEWFVAWISLEAGIALPTAAVLIDLVIGFGINYGIDHLLPAAHGA